MWDRSSDAYIRFYAETIHGIIQRNLSQSDYWKADRENICPSVGRMSPERTKFRIYLELNPELEVDPLYKISAANDTIDDYLRIVFTRLRLCSL